MVEKIILCGTGNDGFRHVYQIEKEKGTSKILIDFMKKLNFEEKIIKEKFHQRYESPIESEENLFAEWNIDVDEIIDKVWYFKNEKFEVEIFFGNQKLFFVVRAKDRKDLVNLVKKESEWKSDDEFEKVRNENVKKLRQRALREIQKRSLNKKEIKNKLK